MSFTRLLCAALLALSSWWWPTGVAATAAPVGPQRIITLAPHLTELVFAAGGGDRVVATVNSSNYPTAAQSLPRVGDGLSVNAEQLLAWRPDWVIAWQRNAALDRLTTTLEGLNIPVTYLAAQKLTDIPAEVEQLGQVLGTEDEAHAVAHALRGTLEELRTRYATATPVSVFIEVGINPMYTLGNDPLIHDALRYCGGVNIYDTSRQVAPTVSAESVLARQPQVVVIATASTQRLAERQAYWQRLQLAAARQHHVYAIDPDYLVRPGPRLVEATARMCRYLDAVRHGFHD